MTLEQHTFLDRLQQAQLCILQELLLLWVPDLFFARSKTTDFLLIQSIVFGMPKMYKLIKRAISDVLLVLT